MIYDSSTVELLSREMYELQISADKEYTFLTFMLIVGKSFQILTSI